MSGRLGGLILFFGGGLVVMAIALGAVAGAVTGAPLRPSSLLGGAPPPGTWTTIADTCIESGESTTVTIGGYPAGTLVRTYLRGVDNPDFSVGVWHMMPLDGSPLVLNVTFTVREGHKKEMLLGVETKLGQFAGGPVFFINGTDPPCSEMLMPAPVPLGDGSCCESVAIDPAPVDQLATCSLDGVNNMFDVSAGWIDFYGPSGNLIQTEAYGPNSAPGIPYCDEEQGKIVVPSRTEDKLHILDSSDGSPSGETAFPEGTVPWAVTGPGTDVTGAPDADLAVTGYGSNDIFLLNWPDGDGPPTITGDPISIPTADSQPTGITFGPEGQDIYFLESAGNNVGRVLDDLSIVEYPIPTQHSRPLNIVVGSDGNIWFTEFDVGKIGRMTPDGEFDEFSLPSSAGQPYDIVPGPGGIYFTAWGLNAVGFIPYSDSALPSIAGQLQSTFVPFEWRLPEPGAIPSSIIELDGAIWFIERGTSHLTKLNPPRSHMPALFTSVSAGW